MLNRETLKAQLPTLVSAFIPRHCQNFRYRVFDDRPNRSPLGFILDPEPFAGKVVAKTEEIVLVQLKGKRSEFAVLDRALLTPEPGENTQVEVHPYARRRFDGLRADTPKEETHTLPDGTRYTTQSMILGQAPAPLPIPTPKSPELQAMIDLLESAPAPDGFRTLTHLLVDAGAHDITWVDPEPEDVIATPPALSFAVSTAKFQGRLTVLYERGLDLYAVELSRDGELIERVDLVYFDILGQVIEDLIDDGSWRKIRVHLL